MRVESDEQRSTDPGACPVLDDRLGRREDVRLVERGVQTRSAVTGRAEHDLLQRIIGSGVRS